MRQTILEIEEISKIVKESNSFSETYEKLKETTDIKKTSKKSVERFIKKNNIPFDHFTTLFDKNRWSKENILNAIDKSETYSDVLINLNLTPCTSSYYRLHKYLNEYDINFNNKMKTSERWSEENLKNILERSYSYSETIINLGLTAKGDNIKTLKKYIKKYELDVLHFKKSRINKRYNLKDVLVENSDYNRQSLKKRLYKEGLKDRECEMCGQGEIWNDMKISLILDHINGINNDNRIENLRIVCPNCNAGLDTHCGKNKK
jgi:hypothetical protein